MISKVKAALANIMGGSGASSSQHSTPVANGSVVPSRHLPERLAVKFPFERPSFLELTPEELQLAADHIHRPVITPPEGRRLLWNAGYAEVINAGKSQNNEDQACCEVVYVERRDDDSRRNSFSSTEDQEEEVSELFFHHWGLFDGHAGPGAAIMASKLLHLQICDQLRDIVDILQKSSVPPPICLSNEVKTQSGPQAEESPTDEDRVLTNEAACRFHQEKQVSHESLVIGAIENAFKQMGCLVRKYHLLSCITSVSTFSVGGTHIGTREMPEYSESFCAQAVQQGGFLVIVCELGSTTSPQDQQIEHKRSTYHALGGCCAMAVVYLLGKLYVANAGDSRAIIIRNGKVIPMSREFTPESERQRLQFLAFLQPELLGNEFTHLEFPRRIQYKELGRRMLFRDHSMTGWAYKLIEEDDLKFPLIYGEGKKARVMATIGVTRGLGDHDLKVYNSNIHIKPFLSCLPEVRVYDLAKQDHCPDDVMVLGTDGLWDVTNDKEVADVVANVLSEYGPDHPRRFTMVAHELVLRSRGILKERGWRLANEKLGSGDDISVFVIPLGGPGTYT
ncbi:protein phosphatase 1J isoform X2 [Ambystoma mexicanum]|uniref:protein phosphatase 1J isoform X2 n=1 Tax=Ambystoma mexicanum TaxID=8296 RepID=UPI0037E91A1D